MKTLLAIIAVSALNAQSPPATVASQQTITATLWNTTIQGLWTGKSSHFSGSGAPGSVTNSTRGDLYLDTVNNDIYMCFVSPGPCTAVAAANWHLFGSGGGGSADACTTVRTSSTVWTLFANATAATPCNFGRGTTVTRITGSQTVTVSAGSFTAYVSVGSGGTVNVAIGAGTAVCSGCTTNTGTSMAAENPYWTWTSTSGTWDVSGGTDFRSYQGSFKPSPVSGRAISVTSGDQDTIAVDGTVVPSMFFGTTTPGSVSGNLPGNFFFDTTNHHGYACMAVSGTSAPACTSVATGAWTLIF